jgi:hypothetical protein
MPTYTFKLRSDVDWVADNVGATLADNASAYRYARCVARACAVANYKRAIGFSKSIRKWARSRYSISFSQTSITLDHLRRELRVLVEKVSEKKRALKDVIHDIGLTVRESQALLARSRGKAASDQRQWRNYNS